ncbi:MAG: hypothetical protein WCF17_01785 [Terracidiphilus sp.]
MAGRNICACGECDESTNGTFAQGHDQRLRSRLEARCGGLLHMRDFIDAAEAYATGRSDASILLEKAKSILQR